MASNDFSMKVDPAGEPVIIQFWIEKVIADWWLTEIRGLHAGKEWDGRMDDSRRDAVAIDPKTLDGNVSLGWNILLFGPAADMTIAVTVEARQDGVLLGQTQQAISLKAKKAQQIAGTISIH